MYRQVSTAPASMRARRSRVNFFQGVNDGNFKKEKEHF